MALRHWLWPDLPFRNVIILCISKLSILEYPYSGLRIGAWRMMRGDQSQRLAAGEELTELKYAIEFETITKVVA